MSANKTIVIALTGLGLMLGNADASVRRYEANTEQSKWTLSNNTRLDCALNHHIARFGEATFVSRAGKSLNLAFELDMMRLPANYGVASVTSVPPAWQPGVPSKTIATMSLKKQFNPDIPEKAAWTMLSELEKGFVPTIYYADWYSPYDKIAVGLSAINFPDAYDQFLLCVDNLLPYSFEDIAYTVLNFEINSPQLSKDSQKRLSQIGEYIKHAPTVDEITIDAYADSYGGRSTNMKMSQKRAAMIADYLVELGVDRKRLVVTGYGEKRHVASNQTELGRATNRRVVVKMTRR